MKKICLLITGQMRTYYKCFDNIINNLIEPNKESYIFDIYILTEYFENHGGSAKNLFSSTPIKCGTRPNWYIGATVVAKVREGVIISLPFLKLNELSPNKFADEPELTIKPYFFPNMFATVLSNFLT